MRKFSILSILLFIVVFLGCDSQKTFKPQAISGKIGFDKKIDSNIMTTNRVSAKLKNNYAIAHDSFEKIILQDNENVLYTNPKEWILTNGCKGIKIIPFNNTKDSNTYTLEREKELLIQTNECVVSASKKDNYVAGVMGDNTSFLYDLNIKDFVFRDKGENIYAISSLIANPVFMDTLVIFPTLDGRLNTLDIQKRQSVRNIIVNTDKFMNNIIYLDIKDDSLVAATQKRIYALIKGESYNMDVEIRDLYFDSNYIYVLGLNGVIYKLDKTLGIIKSTKLPYANLNAIFIKNNHLYTFENSGGYIINLDLDSFSYDVYKLKFGMESMIRWFSKKSSIFYMDNVLYVNKRVLDFNKDLKFELNKK